MMDFIFLQAWEATFTFTHNFLVIDKTRDSIGGNAGDR